MQAHLLWLTGLLVACGSPGAPDDEGLDTEAPSLRLVGALQKGPFVVGSTIEVRALDAALVPTGDVFAAATSNDRGEFVLEAPIAGPVELEGTGFYYNEVTGALSQGNLTLRALHVPEPTAASSSVYVNLLTHLTAGRVRTLVAAGAAFADAVPQAEGEAVAALAISPPGYQPGRPAAAMNLLGGDDDDNAYLLAASAVLAQVGVDRAPGSADAELQALLNGLAADLADDGAIVPSTADAIAAAALALDVEAVEAALQARLAAIGSDAPVPDLARVLDQDGDGLANAVDVCDQVPDDQSDTDLDGQGDACDTCPDTPCPGDCVPRPFGSLGDTCVTRCDADGGCDGDAACVEVPWPGGGVALCVQPCDPDTAGCGDGETCGVWPGDPWGAPVCVPRPVGLDVRGPGESCDGDPLACDDGLLCATFGTARVCATPCVLDEEGACGEASCVVQPYAGGRGACPNQAPEDAICRRFGGPGGGPASWTQSTCADGLACVFSDRCPGGPESCCAPACDAGCDAGEVCVDDRVGSPEGLPFPVCLTLAGLGEPCRYADECGSGAGCFDGASASSSYLPGDCRARCGGDEDCVGVGERCLPVAIDGVPVCAVPE